MYHELHPKGIIPVKANDSFFSIHAVGMNIILLLQCVFFDRGDQKVSMQMGSFIFSVWMTIFVGLLAGLTENLPWLQLLYFLSYVKVGTTPIKYTPQVRQILNDKMIRKM